MISVAQKRYYIKLNYKFKNIYIYFFHVTHEVNCHKVAVSFRFSPQKEDDDCVMHYRINLHNEMKNIKKQHSTIGACVEERSTL